MSRADDLALGLLDALDQLLELLDDLLDLLLVEAHLRSVSTISCLLLGDLFLDFFLATRRRPWRSSCSVCFSCRAETAHLVDELDDALGVPLLVELGVFFVGVMDDLLDADLLLAELVAELEDLLDGDRRVEHDLQRRPLALLDALGDLDFALAGEQRDRAHLAQVHAHRVVGLGVAVVVLLFGLFLPSVSFRVLINMCLLMFSQAVCSETSVTSTDGLGGSTYTGRGGNHRR